MTQRFVLLCHVDQRPCGLACGLPDHAANLEAVRDLLPCADCREPKAHADTLMDGGRIGRRERYVLETAAPLRAAPVIVQPEGSTRADREAHSRAIRNLAKAGLVKVVKKKVDVTTKTVASTFSGYR